MLTTNAMGPAALPAASDGYKRAVVHPPPSRFTIQMLEPAKQGGQYSFGMRISAVATSDRSSISSRGSGSSISEYDIWRRWEDCLWFQDAIEVEYERMARMKRQRLKAGKGVKKNGFYKQDQASSWDSLPPGPAPDSIGHSIHTYVPKLTKKGTLFRASQATIDQRHKELKAFVMALLGNDVPALVDELRDDRLVTDFFGYWKRDEELDRKLNPRKHVRKDRSLVTQSTLSSYFSPSIAESDASSVQTSASTIRGAGSPHPSPRRRKQSSDSTDSSSLPSSRSSNGSMMSVPSIVEDVPVVFGHNPIADKGGLETLPEDSVPGLKPSPDRQALRRSHRQISIFGAGSLSPPTNGRNVRESWMSTASASTYLEGLDYGLSSAPAGSRLSVATFMTDCSADAVIPRSADPETRFRRSASSDTRRRRPLSSGSNDSYGSSDEDYDDDMLLDTPFYESFPIPAFHLPLSYQRPRSGSYSEHDSRRDTLLASQMPGLSIDTSGSVSSSGSSDSLPSPPVSELSPTNETKGDFPFSPTSSMFSESTIRASTQTRMTPIPPSPTTSTCFSLAESTATSPSSGAITVKAAHNKSIILLRVSRDSDFLDVRQRIQQKFITQEGVPISDMFTLAVMESPKASPGRRPRSDSVGSANGFQQLTLVLNQRDWERALACLEGSKLTLRVLDNLS